MNQKAPPNLLLIHSDQHRYDCVGANGHPFVQTPHLDRLAQEGARFTQAFTPNPVCSPARACLMTGAWSTTHGCVTIPGTEVYRPADPDLPNLYQLLTTDGYQIAHIGKFHGELRGNPTDHGAQFYVPANGYATWRAAQNLPPPPRMHGWFGETDPAITPEQSALHWQADRAITCLETLAERDQPFLLRWDPPEPHLPNLVPEPYASLYPREKILPWPSFPDDLVGKPPAQTRSRDRWGVTGWSWDDWQPVVQRYLGEITLLDAEIGRVLKELDQLGLTENTLVIYATDHGDHCGGHGLMDKHYQMYDEVLRVPLLLRWPGKVAPGTVCDAFVSHEIDLAKTLLTAANVTPPSSFVGRDLIAAAAGELPNPRTDIFAQYMGTHQGLYSLRMLRDRRWKYVYHPAAFDELYDLDQDPGETNNLSADSTHHSELRRLRARMGEWMEKIGDPLSSPLFFWDHGTDIGRNEHWRSGV